VTTDMWDYPTSAERKGLWRGLVHYTALFWTLFVAWGKFRLSH